MSRLIELRCGSDVLENPITVNCTKSEAAWIETALDHIEAHQDDANRCRFIYTGGRKSAWFSRCWELTYAHVAPLCN